VQRELGSISWVIPLLYMGERGYNTFIFNLVEKIDCDGRAMVLREHDPNHI